MGLPSQLSIDEQIEWAIVWWLRGLYEKLKYSLSMPNKQCRGLYHGVHIIVHDAAWDIVDYICSSCYSTLGNLALECVCWDQDICQAVFLLNGPAMSTFIYNNTYYICVCSFKGLPLVRVSLQKRQAGNALGYLCTLTESCRVIRKVPVHWYEILAKWTPEPYYGKYSAALFLCCDRSCPRPGGLPTNVYDICAVCYQFLGLDQSYIYVHSRETSIAKAVRGGIQDAHDMRSSLPCPGLEGRLQRHHCLQAGACKLSITYWRCYSISRYCRHLSCNTVTIYTICQVLFLLHRSQKVL